MIVVIFSGFSLLAGQAPENNQGVLVRHYREGEKLTYVMKGANEGRHYSLQADGTWRRKRTAVSLKNSGGRILFWIINRWSCRRRR